MSAESATEEEEVPGGSSPCQPRFPIFPFVFPLMFPIGMMALISRRRDRRERALEMRLEEVEGRLDDLEEKLAKG